MYSDLSPGRYTLRIAAINYKKEDRAIVRRKFEVPPADNVCLVHLVNDGLVVEETTGNVTIDFGGVGPVESFLCSLDKGDAEPCKEVCYIEFPSSSGGVILTQSLLPVHVIPPCYTHTCTHTYTLTYSETSK